MFHHRENRLHYRCHDKIHLWKPITLRRVKLKLSCESVSDNFGAALLPSSSHLHSLTFEVQDPYRAGINVILSFISLLMCIPIAETMITDTQLAFIANSLGVATMVLIVVYHYVSVNDSAKHKLKTQ